MNQYEKAIYEVGQVLQRFAFKGKFTMYGFGGVPNYLAKTEEDAQYILKNQREYVKCWNLADYRIRNNDLALV